MTPRPLLQSRRGLTLVELSLVIFVLLALTAVGVYMTDGMSEWNNGKDAAEKLRTVYAAQRAYLADNPTIAVSSLTSTRLIPYLPTGETTIPTVKDKNGNPLTIKLNVSPPVVLSASGTTYDPSGSSSDGLWDVGK